MNYASTPKRQKKKENKITSEKSKAIYKNSNKSKNVLLIFVSGAVLVLGIILGNSNKLPSIFTSGEYSIGIYEGESPLDIRQTENINNPVLTASMVNDRIAEFVADPFIIKDQNIWYMFFEVLDKKDRKGIIGYATSKNLKNWKYEKIILDEKHHLSYPSIFKNNEHYYMIPESHQVYSVRLYKAERFPEKWVFVKELIKGNFSDPSIVKYNNKWWIFASDRLDVMHVYYADSITAEWKPHRLNPVIMGDYESARPGGGIIEFDGKLIRYTQDCKEMYGMRINAFIITELTEDTYIEEKYTKNPILEGTGKGWNSARMHHCAPYKINENQWIASVDGVSKKITFGYKRK
jgi:predicted GH43/DUF377 family glycosyl hydrolase